MNQEQLIAYHRDCCDKLTKLVATKNTDYSGVQVEEDAFANFKKAEVLGICSVEQGMLVRISDKIGRVISFMQRGELLVKDESVQDTLLDGANYMLLLAGYLESKKPLKQNKVWDASEGHNPDDDEYWDRSDSKKGLKITGNQTAKFMEALPLAEEGIVDNRASVDLQVILNKEIKSAVNNINKDIKPAIFDSITEQQVIHEPGVNTDVWVEEVAKVKATFNESGPIVNKDNSSCFVTEHSTEEIKEIFGDNLKPKFQAVSQLDPEVKDIFRMSETQVEEMNNTLDYLDEQDIH